MAKTKNIQEVNSIAEKIELSANDFGKSINSEKDNLTNGISQKRLKNKNISIGWNVEMEKLFKPIQDYIYQQTGDFPTVTVTIKEIMKYYLQSNSIQ